MDPVLAEAYSLIIPAAPYVIVAYVGMWLALCIFLILTAHRMRNAEKQLAVLEELVAERTGNHPAATSATPAADAGKAVPVASDAASVGVAPDRKDDPAK